MNNFLDNFCGEHLPYIAGILCFILLAPPVMVGSAMISIRVFNALSPTHCIQKIPPK